MSKHLRECEENAQYPDPAEHDCICAALRACEQRVRAEYVDTFVWADGKRVGLQAARDAVAALYESAGKYAQDMIDPDDALAAIDALKGEQA